MVKAGLILKCAWCKGTFSKTYPLDELMYWDWGYINDDVMEYAYQDGWSETVDEDTGKYQVVCPDCLLAIAEDCALCQFSDSDPLPF